MASPANVPWSTPIAQLNPDLEPDDSSVTGIVTLIWPYAASKSTFSLLLVEPDFRLRSNRGQVRVHFQGSSAKAVARSGISSGDQLQLSLKGAQWAKDSTAATTPGRSIDWQLQYGERLVLQIHRPSQHPIRLDINHPTPSPEPPGQTSTQAGSPTHNIHHAYSAESPQLDAQIWASPAFLKRSHFLATDYNPFAVEEFPDNDRRKRIKFGRGSGQWRFAERTPSPEMETEIPPFDVASPSRPSAQDRLVVKEAQTGNQTHGTTSPSIASSTATNAVTDRSELEVLSEGGTTAKDTSVQGKEKPSTSLDQVYGAGHMIHEVIVDESIEKTMIHEFANDGNIASITNVMSETPQTKLEFNEVEVGGSKIGSTSPSSKPHCVVDEFPKEQAQIVQTSPPVLVEVSSSVSSSASKRGPDLEEESDQASKDSSQSESDSLFDEQSESGQSSAAIYSGPGPDIGLDGSVFSRPPPAAEFAPPLGAVKKLEDRLEAHSASIDVAQDVSTPLHSDAEQIENRVIEPSFSGDSASDSSNSEDEGSEEDTDVESYDAAQRRSSGHITSSDEFGSPEAEVLDDQAMQDLAASQLHTGDRNAGTDLVLVQNESAVQRSLSNASPIPNQFGSQEFQEKPALQSPEVSDDEAALERVPKQSPADSSERMSTSSSRERVDLLTALGKEIILETSPEKNPLGSIVRQELLIPRQHEMLPDAKISVEDSKIPPQQDQEVRDRAGNASTAKSELRQTMVEIIDLESGDDDNSSPQNVSQKGSQVLVDQYDSKFARINETPMVLLSDSRNERQTSIDEVYHPSTFLNSTGLALEPAMAVENFASVGTHSESEAREEALELKQEGSGPNSPVVGNERYQAELPLNQEASLVRSEATLKDDILPLGEKPRLKQFAVSETELEPKSTGELPSTVPDSVEETKRKSQLLTPSSTQQTHSVSQSSSVSLHSAPEDDTLPTPRLTQGTSVGIVLPQPLAPPEDSAAAKTTAPAKKTSALIEKLKEMRRLSYQSPKPRPSEASILDPWFAPRRTSQAVPDSEDGSEAEDSPEREAQASVPQIINRQLPQTPEKPLAKSFIRSPSQPNYVASIQSSPQYLPPSQPPPPGFRTNLSYFVPLASLPSHFATTVDVLAIALSSTPVTRAKSGPMDYNQSLHITDPSSLALPYSITTAQIFRPNNRCFPLVEKGAALLLRDFKVQPFEKRLLLLSTESSAWAVFRKGADVQIRGPPVEYEAEERGFARGLWDWWASLSDDAKKRLEDAVPEYKKPNGTAKTAKFKAGGDKSDATVTKEIKGLGIDLPSSQSQRRKSMEERSLALDGVEEYDMVRESIEAPKRVLRARGAKSANGRSESARESRFGTVFTGGLGEPDETQGSAHELRDGKAYRAKGR